ncbi:hypothetical protein [Nocardia wallacei]|uniref:Uncharacterized protein n=1 Tax=Nocardia wallacei TaxID=480035 RepID=A0A7G1KQF7_9NOCA|nr:hypothetical protein [Nocardia wallacei]BCK57515.1 hypothetical protein NWFMUON74_52870 [Nocardia wallacei]
MDDLQRRILTTVQHARRGLDEADARLMERRAVDLRAEIDDADYGQADRLRLIACCSEAQATARWVLGRPSTTLPPMRGPSNRGSRYRRAGHDIGLRAGR